MRNEIVFLPQYKINIRHLRTISSHFNVAVEEMVNDLFGSNLEKATVLITATDLRFKIISLSHSMVGVFSAPRLVLECAVVGAASHF